MSTDAAGGYHGYWAQDLYAINAHYGSANDLKKLVDAAHEKVRNPRPHSQAATYSPCSKCTS